MEPYPLRQLATSHSGQRIAAGHFKRTVLIWSIHTGNAISEFDTTLDFGGRRLAISPDGLRCVAAAYHVHGVACYATDTGAEQWRRKDLKKAQFVSILPRWSTRLLRLQ